MNFDDLHDPDPPRPGSAALAAVAARARQIRRRRRTALAAAGALAAVAVVVPTALAVTGDDASERMVPAAVPGTTLPGPDSTVESTTVPDPTPPPPPSSTTSTTSTTIAPAIRPAVLAVRSDGDAVRLEPDGTETVLYDEFPPGPGVGSDPSVEGGDSAGADSIAVTGDGRQFVSLCCEPVVGSWFEIGAEDAVRHGTHLDVSPDGTRLVASGGSFVAVYAPDGTMLADVDVSASPVYTQIEHAMWLDDATLALLVFQDGPTFRLLTVDAALGDVDPNAGVVIPALPAPEAPWPVLGGVGGDGTILVFQGAGEHYASTTLQAYDAVTVQRRPDSDVTIPEPATFAWFRDGLLTWIGIDGSLHVGAAVVPGEYFWARPVS